MRPHFQQKGQALILIALAAVGLFAFAALAIDGSRVYSEKRNAQNAADTASLAGALAYTRADHSGDDDDDVIPIAIIEDAVKDRATSNGYDDGASNDVTITITAVPTTGTAKKCPGKTKGVDVTVKIVTYINTTFARILGRDQVTTAVTATSRACGYYRAPLLGEYAIRGLNDYNTDDPKQNSPCSINSWNGDWTVTGAGMISNGCAAAHKDVNVDEGDSVTSVGTAKGFPSDIQVNQDQGGLKVKYPDDVDAIMPDNPCTGTPVGGRYPGGGKVSAANQLTFNNDIFCLDDIAYFDKENIYVNKATLYITDPDFDLKFASGEGGFSGTATEAGTYPGSDKYDGYFMVIAMRDDDDSLIPTCTDYHSGPQTMVLRGNVGDDLTGTILAPAACLDLNGTSDGHAMNSQIIAYTVSSNGDSTLTVNYDEDLIHTDPKDPTVAVWK